MKINLGKVIFCWIVVSLFAAPGFTQTSSYNLAGTTVEPGTVRNLTLDVAAGKDDPATYIPVTVIHSGKKGPVLLVTAGVHGYEFPPVLAARELANDISPNNIKKGTLIIVRVAHIAAFEERVPFTNPYDRKNLNRSFPGSPDGTQAERIAYRLTKDLIERADMVLDLHGGDGGEWLEPFIGVYGGPLSTNYELAFSSAKVSGFENLVTYQMNRQIDRGLSLNRAAVNAKKPTLLIEAGENGKRDPEYVDLLTRSVKNIMVHLDMLDTSFQTPASEKINDFDSEFSISSPASGIWVPAVTSAQHINKGQIIGTLYDYFGKEITTIKSSKPGFAIYGQLAPSVKKGQGLIFIANYRGMAK